MLIQYLNILFNKASTICYFNGELTKIFAARFHAHRGRMPTDIKEK
ncbi:hypothetical protein HMPREF0758_2462 [Serratia odorifera DSM 4582]|uniref:Uncharacterized protein n=1 Tax=Serratia odorifera DSM 4582 TaxID=667129 RepID=D4E2R2_SEROD|nr:hypothetical protein HMPREF0758_2462 [Serratia odorifera DSM 4582]